MKRVVISGSAKLQDSINFWIKYFENKGFNILDYPRPIEKEKFMELYPKIHKDFFENITETDILFVMNETKEQIDGYIGAETFAELTFALMQNLIYNKNIQIVILRMPSINVQSYEEINLWLKLGWIKLLENIYELKE